MNSHYPLTKFYLHYPLKLEHLINTLRDVFCGARILSYVERITQYHRIQASPGFHAVADELYHLLRDHGVPAEILSFPACLLYTSDAADE